MFGVLEGRMKASLVAVSLVAAIACNKDDMAGDAMHDTAMGAVVGLAPAEYTVVLKSSWTKANHPFEYPAAGAISGPHFSGVIGASHDATYSLFSDGALPTPGLERLSEEGKHDPLDAEIRAAVTAGTAGALFESGPLRDFADSIVTTVKVDERHPFVSVVAMVAPSPDWFTGAANVNLVENGGWVQSRTIELLAWDSGGDDGATYKAADKDNTPKKPTSKAMTPHFVVNGVAVPVGSVTFIKK
jgi:hypothetical protein